MASITKRGNSYRISVSNGLDDNCRQIKETMTFKPDPSWSEKRTLKEVQRVADEFEQKVKYGKLFEGGKMSFAAFSDRWFHEYVVATLSPTTQVKYEDVLRNHLIPKLGRQKMRNLNSFTLQEFFSQYYDDQTTIEYNPATIRKIQTVLKSIFKKAYQWHILEENPMDRVYLPHTTSASAGIKFFTPEEARRFLAYIAEPYEVKVPAHTANTDGMIHQITEYTVKKTVQLQLQVFYMILIYGGFRKGEALALTWDDIDFEGCTIKVSKTLCSCYGETIIKAPKTKSSNRTVSMPPSVMALMKRHQEEQREEATRLAGYCQECNLVFTRDDGSYMGYSTPYQALKSILARYNEEHPDSPLPDITLHGLRHTTATIMVAEHADPVTVAARLGHSNVNTTLNVYSHALQTSDQKASDLLESVLG